MRLRHLVSVLAVGNVGGLEMDAAAILYGSLCLACCCATGYYARERQIKRHRRCALRLYKLGFGSVCYRFILRIMDLQISMSKFICSSPRNLRRTSENPIVRINHNSTTLQSPSCLFCAATTVANQRLGRLGGEQTAPTLINPSDD
uniref:Uncharacterized protein n=1 Tax=Spongospora subterranea TaxID=70186 RepID=A0A0H5RRW4_9EUKA|eukprot:CRZ11464.1 hypothetical protein [Spongospora subterranea]